MEGRNIHQRVLKLRDVALGSKKAVPVSSNLAPASYDCAIDSLMALYSECKSASSLAKDKHILKFINKYESTVSALKSLRVSAEDFEMKTIIGRGHFGEVVLSKEKSTGDVFATKIMKKAHILQQPDAAFYSAERDIMAWSTSPWLTCLHYAFQDSTSLYLVMDYHPGGDLLNIMERKEGSMREDEARFYLTEIAAGLHDLHGLGFVHRDVKPENVLIARSGHIKLVDFGSAARLGSNGKVIESQLPVGTPEYISPEVLTCLDRAADYGVCCDWWSLGIIAYELLYEATPFEGDTTTKTYSNIMNYKKSLSFPENGSIGFSNGETKDLIKKLLTDMKSRLTYDGIKNHPFFSVTDWDSLLNITPPHIPTVSGADDVSNFDVFEPCKDNDLRYPDMPSKSAGFSGRSLPFVGFTFTGPITSADFTDNVIPPEGAKVEGVGSKELRKALQLAKKELEVERAKNMSLERECVVYQSQLEDFHRKLEMEKSDRRLSDSRAIQLLQEVREKGKLAQQLREDRARTTEREYTVVVEQLESERQEASKRSQKLQEKLSELQNERDSALKKGSEYKAKLAEVKEGCRKEMTNLQARLAKVSRESGTKVEESQERLAEALKKKDLAETAKKKTEMELRKLKTNCKASKLSSEDLSKQLEDAKSSLEVLHGNLSTQLKANEYLKRSSTSLTEQLKKMEDHLEEIHTQNKRLESSKLGVDNQLCDLGMEIEEVKRERDTYKVGQGKTARELKTKNLELKKLKESMSKLEMKLSEANTLREIGQMTKSEERLKKKVEGLEKEKQKLKGDLATVNTELKNSKKEEQSLASKLEEAERSYTGVVSGLRGEVQALQTRLTENQAMALQEDDKLRELRRLQRELKQQNADLSTRLSMVQVESEKLTAQLKESSTEVESLRSARDSLKLEESKTSALQIDCEATRKEVLSTHGEIRKLKAAKKQAEEKMHSIQKKFEVQELNASLLQRSVKSLKDELKDAKTAAVDAQKQQAHWKAVKETVEGDLETAETKLDAAYNTIETEKKSRLAAEHRMSEVAQDMEQQLSSHVEELQTLSNQLLMQKELAAKYSVKVMELEKETRLKTLSLKETQKGLNTEKAVSSKFYDEIQLKSRELNKLKAAHMKLLRETQQLNAELAQREQILTQHKKLGEERQLQDTRLQATIAQQGKLIDYLQGVGQETETRGLGRLKGLKLGRKGRDPAKEIAEWNKLKGIAGKGNSSGITQSTSQTSITETSHSTDVFPHTTSTDPPLTELHSEMEYSSANDIGTSTPTTTPAAVAGAKRKSGEVSSAASTSTKQASGRHNIPHIFRGISKSGLRSNYTCAACKKPIKAFQKLIKCSHCHIPCHTQCIDSIPKNCGLSQELLAHVELEPPAKKPRQEDTPIRTANQYSVPVKDPEEKTQKSTPKKKSKRGDIVVLKVSKTAEACGTGLVDPIDKVTEKKKQKGKVKLSKVSQLSGGEEATDGRPSSKKESTLLQVSKVTSSSAGHEEGKGTPGHAPVAVDRTEGTKRNSPAAASASGGGGGSNHPKNLYTGFEASKVLKMERTCQPRAGMMTEGWLVLTKATLCLYDRDPRGVTRKPIHRFVLNEPGVAYLVLPSVTRQTFPHTTQAGLVQAFGLQVHSSSYSKELCFMACSLQSKIDWVESIQKVLSEHTSQPATQESLPEQTSSSKSGARELKAVSIVPVSTSTTPQNTGGKGGRTGSNLNTPVMSAHSAGGLDLSIRSSMMEDSSSSDTSFI